MLHSVEHVTRSFRLMLTHGLWKELLQQSWQKVFSTRVYVDAVLDVGTYKPAGRYPVPLSVRAIGAADGSLLQAVLSDRTLASEERHEASRRVNMLATGIRTCFAVCDDSGNVRVLQWLILADENETVRRIYADWYPWLADDEALMEHAYVFPPYRGTGVLSCAVDRIVEVARASGVAHILTSIPGSKFSCVLSCASSTSRPLRIRLEPSRFGAATRTVLAVGSCNDPRAFARVVAVPAVLDHHTPEPVAF